MEITKRCRDKDHVGERLLPLSQFPRRHSETDGLAPICKICNTRRVHKAAARGTRGPMWAKKILQLLNQQNIPCHAGGAKFGHPYVDLMAWGCVRIELKFSSDHAKGDKPSFHWTFNKRQTTEDTCDVVILVGIARSSQEYILILTHPKAQELLNSAANHGKGGAIECVIGSEHHNASKWQRLAEWQNRFDVIELVRREYAQGLRRVAAGRAMR